MKIQQQIEHKLKDALTPEYLEVINESGMHNVPKGSESHFKVIIVSEYFNDLRLLQRHRAVNRVLETELNEHIHALAMHTYTNSEWLEKIKLHHFHPNVLVGVQRKFQVKKCDESLQILLIYNGKINFDLVIKITNSKQFYVSGLSFI